MGTISSMALFACSSKGGQDYSKTVVVTHSVLGEVVQLVASDEVEIVVLVPNGAEVHDFEPSAKDIELMNKAALVVANGLDFESGLVQSIKAREDSGSPVYFGSDHVDLLTYNGNSDPHYFVDPQRLISLIPSLASAIDSATGTKSDASLAISSIQSALDSVGKIGANPTEIITGHEFLRYFCDQFECNVVASVIDSLSPEAEVSASHLRDINNFIQGSDWNGVLIVETGTKSKFHELLPGAKATEVIEISVESVPESGGYISYLNNVARAVFGKAA